MSTAAQSVENMVLVTGDDHDGWAGELWDTGFARARRAVSRSTRPAPGGRASSSWSRPSRPRTPETVGTPGAAVAATRSMRPAPRRPVGALTTRTSSMSTWSATATVCSTSTRMRRASVSVRSTSWTRIPM
ncbi:hypothetical protein P9209_22420 [Prescottella defluvii]|nr:hypothetical protein P9209_22420 [Prescottella defluvii]